MPPLTYIHGFETARTTAGGGAEATANPRNIIVIMLLAMLAIAGCTQPDRSEEADRVTDELKELMFKNPEQALALVDSAEQAGVYSAADANLLRVNIYWNTGQKRMAAFCGEQAFIIRPLW